MLLTRHVGSVGCGHDVYQKTELSAFIPPQARCRTSLRYRHIPYRQRPGLGGFIGEGSMGSSNALDPQKRRYIRLHLRDLLSSSTWNRCNATERGIYLSLLLHSYLTPDGILREETPDLQVLCGCNAGEWSKAWRKIKSKFISKDGGICNPRVREEIAYIARRSRKATSSIKSRWDTNHTNVLRTNYDSDTNVIPPRAGSESSPSEKEYVQKKSTSKKKTLVQQIKELGDKEYLPGFLRAWAVYPNTAGKREAFRAYCKHILAAKHLKEPARPVPDLDAEAGEVLEDGILKDLDDPSTILGAQAVKEQPSYRHFATWINKHTWEDWEGDGKDA